MLFLFSHSYLESLDSLGWSEFISSFWTARKLIKFNNVQYITPLKWYHVGAMFGALRHVTDSMSFAVKQKNLAYTH